MAILRLSNVRREIGTFVVLDSVNASMAHEEKVGLVGANGAGKTTLLRIVAGLEVPDSGQVSRRSGLALALLTQEANLDPALISAPELRAAVRSGAGDLEAMERRLAELEASGAEAVTSAEYAELRDRFEVRGGYSLDVRVDAALSGLGFERADWTRPVGAMSGGQQTRAALARLLVAELDLLMLDEPTNHLDVTAIEWLEGTLAARAGALLVASHDRAFLDATIGRIWELRDRRLTVFRGNYSAYLTQREERDARARKDATVRSESIDRERELVQRYRSHRKFSKMHEHERRLEALQDQAEDSPERRAGAALALGGIGAISVRSGDVVVSLEDLVAGYEDKPVIRIDRLEARRGARIGLIGPNGAGKTTLMRTIAGELQPLDGVLRLGHKVQIGYLAQVRRLPAPGTTVLEALANGAGLDEGPARSYLARFLFRGDDVFKAVEKLSGGERSRLELALVGLQAANLLLLDEPTNHLDIPAREALETFLRDASGTVIVVSHDRRLLDAVCTELWVVVDGADNVLARAARFNGSYSEWRAAQSAGWTVDKALAGRLETAAAGSAQAATSAKGRPAASGSGAPVTNGAGRSRGRARAGAGPRLSKDAYRRRRQVVEDDLTRLGLRKSQLELALGDPSVQSNFVELRRVSSELADVDAALAQAEDAWLTLAEQAPR
jgi:ATP-binding cassette subfamily F protein 3